MASLTLMIIRHAEKPGGSWPGPGYTDQGDKDDKSLVIRGWQRAGAWAALFGAGVRGADYPKPTAIYAATSGDPGRENHGPSRRPAETLSALAAQLGVAVNTRYAHGDEANLMREVLALAGVVLISWEHHAIVDGILPKIPVGTGSPPTRWNGERFDVVLRFDSPTGAAPFAFRELHPCLLSGDSNARLDH